MDFRFTYLSSVSLGQFVINIELSVRTNNPKFNLSERKATCKYVNNKYAFQLDVYRTPASVATVNRMTDRQV